MAEAGITSNIAGTRRRRTRSRLRIPQFKSAIADAAAPAPLPRMATSSLRVIIRSVAKNSPVLAPAQQAPVKQRIHAAKTDLRSRELLSANTESESSPPSLSRPRNLCSVQKVLRPRSSGRGAPYLSAVVRARLAASLRSMRDSNVIDHGLDPEYSV